jgi:CubicO group peptidase (beta-lactamase class C family)
MFSWTIDKINAYINNFTSENGVTIHHLLSHSSPSLLNTGKIYAPSFQPETIRRLDYKQAAAISAR